VTRLRKLRENVIIQVRVEGEDGILYCMPSSYTHGIVGLRLNVSGMSID